MPAAIWSGSLSLGLVFECRCVCIRPCARRWAASTSWMAAARGCAMSACPSRRSTSKAGVGSPRGRRSIPLSPPPHSSPFVHSEPAPVWSAASQEIPYEEIRKGYEVASCRHVSLTREEVAALGPERTREIDVERFVDAPAIDPMHVCSAGASVTGGTIG
jgi:hypothetical protein